jgi:hypothetical protein
MPAAMNPPSGLVLQVRSDAMLHQRFPQRKRFTAFFAGFLHVSPLKSVEIAVFGRKSETDEEKRGSRDGASVPQRAVQNRKKCGWKAISILPMFKEDESRRMTQLREVSYSLRLCEPKESSRAAFCAVR